MTIRRPQLHIPLLYKEISLRILIISATAIVALNISILVKTLRGASARDYRWFPGFLPLLVILHHILRLWQRRRWLVICEVLTSLAEVVLVGYFYIPGIRNVAQNLRVYDKGANTPPDLLIMGLELAMVASSFVSCLFLFCDVLSNHWNFFFRQYNFSADLQQPGHRWGFIFGSFTTKRRFSTDNLLIRCVRGGFAILTLLGMLFLVFYASVWQPIQLSERPVVKTFSVPVSAGTFSTTLGSMVAVDDYTVYREETHPNRVNFSSSDFNLAFRAILVIPLPAPKVHPTMNMNITSHFLRGTNKTVLCEHSQTQAAVQVYCLADAMLGIQTIELLLTVHFSGVSGDFPVYLGLGVMPESINDIAAGEPIGVGPGLNLHGWSSVAVNERLLDQKAATFGIPKVNIQSITDMTQVVINTHGLSPDWMPSLPRDNNTGTLRLTFPPQQEIEIQQQYMEGSVINGFALIGGVWTLVNGVFATIFGSTLLLVLFGIKPLSIYGLVHHLRPGRGSLVDANFALLEEERDRTVGILREHLLDVDDADGGQNSSSQAHNVTLGRAFDV